jgi:hypothetical protein
MGPAPKVCGECMMCCKLPSIEEPLHKPENKWCINALPGRGCKIYETRPQPCRNFHCDWLLQPGLGDEWKPSRARFLMYDSPDGRAVILVDPATPHAWKGPVFYPVLKQGAVRRLELEGRITTVLVGERLFIILPDRDEVLPRLSSAKFGVVARRDGERMNYEVIVEYDQEGSSVSLPRPKV